MNLDSNPKLNETEPGTTQMEWLENDLAWSTAACSMVFFHHPVFSVGTHGDTSELAALWTILAKHDVTLVLTAHDHHCQRWLPPNAAGKLDAMEPTTLVVGAGGQSEYSSLREGGRLDGPFLVDPGAPRMELNPDGAPPQFVTTDGVVRNNTVMACDRSTEAVDTRAPTTPGKPTVFQEADETVVVRWAPAVDGTGTAADDIYRNDAMVGSVVPGVSFVDAGLSGVALASCRVVARDDAGNELTPSESAGIIPGHDPSNVCAGSFGIGSLQRWTTVSGLVIEPAPDADRLFGTTARARGGIRSAFARVDPPRPAIPPASVDLTVTLDFRVLSQGPNPVVLLRLFSRDSDSLLGASLDRNGELTIRNDVTKSVNGRSTVVTCGEWHRLTVRLSGPRESPRLAVTLDDCAVAEVAGTIDLRAIRIDKVQLGDSTGHRVYDVQYRTITIAFAVAVAPRGIPPSPGTVSQGPAAPASACSVTGQRGGSGGYRISASLAGSDASARPATTRIRDMDSDEWPPVSDTCSRSFSRALWRSPLMNTSAPRDRVAPRRGARRIPLPSRLPPRPREPCSGHAARDGARPCGISLHTPREPPRPGEPR